MSDEAVTADTESAVAPEVTPEDSGMLEEIRKVRRENAKYRTERNEALAAIEALKKSHGDQDAAFNDLQAELSARSLELLKLKTVLAEGIPAEDVLDVAALIQGDDEATVSDSVKRVKSLLDKAPARERPVDPSQGSGNVLPLNGDPLLETVKRMVGA
jgi:hypothetical protein